MAAVKLHISPLPPYWEDAATMPPAFRPWFVRFQNWMALTEAQLTDPATLTNTVKN